MGIQVNETKTIGNTDVELSNFYVGIRKRNREHASIELSSNSNTYTITGHFEHHVSKDAKTQGKMPIDYQLVTVSNISVDSNINIVSELYTELKKGYDTFTDNI
jgi:hypothetical protein